MIAFRLHPADGSYTWFVDEERLGVEETLGLATAMGDIGGDWQWIGRRPTDEFVALLETVAHAARVQPS